ncbi:NADP-dependent oxidoreductase domain-containing protein [Pelagophyceae sp. CCMP2097]|nr:NADP-dependent oxidoreductase domain-containing protein [Pelagophyceae sp. CCMP2097]
MKMRFVGVLEVSEICLGTMTWGEQNTEAEAHEQLDYALAHGVNFIDTAELYPVPALKETYGDCEKYIGTWLAADATRRGKIVLASKVAGPGRPHIPAMRAVALEGAEVPEEPSSLTRAQILRACDASLKRLQTDYLDLYQIHWPDRYTNVFGARAYERENERDCVAIDEQVSAVGELLVSKKIKAWGLSNENGVGVATFLEAARRLGVPPPATIQNDFSLLHRKFEEDGTAEACAPLFSRTETGVGLMAYGCLAGGALSGKIRRTAEGTAVAPPGCRHLKFPDFQARYISAASLDAAAALAALAKKYGMTASQLAYVWARDREYMGAVIIGATSMAQLVENIAAFELPPLTAEQLEEVDNATLSSHYHSGVGAVKIEEDTAALPPPPKKSKK